MEVLLFSTPLYKTPSANDIQGLVECLENWYAVYLYGEMLQYLICIPVNGLELNSAYAGDWNNMEQSPARHPHSHEGHWPHTTLKSLLPFTGVSSLVLATNGLPFLTTYTTYKEEKSAWKYHNCCAMCTFPNLFNCIYYNENSHLLISNIFYIDCNYIHRCLAFIVLLSSGSL